MRNADWKSDFKRRGSHAPSIRIPKSVGRRVILWPPSRGEPVGPPAGTRRPPTSTFKKQRRSMAEFICRLGTPAGGVVTRTVEAVGGQEARVRLEAEGFRVFSVAPPRAAGLGALTRGGKGGTQARVKPGDFLLFNQQLSAIIRAGIPILQAVAMLRRRATSSRLRAVLSDVEEKIRSGMALSTAFAAQGPIFPRIYTASILAGERSGALDEVLARYVEYMRRGVEIRRKIRGALAYPLFLLAASFGMVMFLTVYVVPKMSSLFEGFNRELPAVTQVVIGISHFASGNFYWLAPTVIIGGVGLYLWSRTPSGALALDRLMLRLPIVSALGKQLATAQGTRSLEIG